MVLPGCLLLLASVFPLPAARGDGAPGPGPFSAVNAPQLIGVRRSSDTVAIDFETYPDGTPACEYCPLSDEYRSLGVIFSFRSWTAGARYPYLVDAGSYLPEDAERPHGVVPALQERGLEVGVIRMQFPDAPTRVAFDLTGPDLIDRFAVTAWTPRGRVDTGAILRRRPQTFHAAGGGVFRQERVTVENAAGIVRIELDGWGPPGHLMLIDNLSVGDDASPRPAPR
jgi:hypothetical protein